MARSGLAVQAGFRLLSRALEELDTRRGLSNQESAFVGRRCRWHHVDWLSLRGGIDRIHPQPGGIAIEKGVQRRGTDGLVYFLKFDASGRLWRGQSVAWTHGMVPAGATMIRGMVWRGTIAT